MSTKARYPKVLCLFLLLLYVAVLLVIAGCSWEGWVKANDDKGSVTAVGSYDSTAGKPNVSSPNPYSGRGE